MAIFSRAIFRISQFIRWHEKDQLILQPKFQRRSAWEPVARAYLIDTIVRELPLPKVYLRKIVSPKTDLMAYEVVDGQQRLRAILDFHAGELSLNQRHNPDLGGETFNTLPEGVRRSFLEYEISTEVMEKATDPEVWAMFERLNTYTITLNKQEKLNSKWFGYFKQTAYSLAAEESALEAWKQLGIFSNQQIARMKEVEMTSDVLVALVQGISDITDIAKLYEKYDSDFPKRKEVSDRFTACLSWITRELSDSVGASRFRRRTWFYSLLVATADALYGIPKGKGRKPLRESREIAERMIQLDEALKIEDPRRLPRGLAKLQKALSSQTSHIPPRLVRHDFFFTMLTSQDAKWIEKQRR
jgi:hypothetical protein